MMNNYFTSDSEFARRSQMQERHYELLNRLQSLSSEVPTYASLVAVIHIIITWFLSLVNFSSDYRMSCYQIWPVVYLMKRSPKSWPDWRTSSKSLKRLSSREEWKSSESLEVRVFESSSCFIYSFDWIVTELKVDQQKRHRQALSDGSITYEQMLREERVRILLHPVFQSLKF